MRYLLCWSGNAPSRRFSGQIRDYALPFFARFSDLPKLLDDVEREGFFPYRRGFDVPKRNREFIECFPGVSEKDIINYSKKTKRRKAVWKKSESFLSEPEEHQDEFWESDALIWVDWRDFDESIIEYFIKNCLMKIKFSLNVWKQKKNAVLIFL